ncbi:adenylate cyclase [Coniochaeta sp. 2T2.1]|nr:adenylate cyclase [Coniochaeta sp. 2T2.1]
MTGGERSGSVASTGGIPGNLATSFYNDSSDNVSLASQVSPGLRPFNVGSGRTPATSTDSHETAYFNDDRRPSIASITTTASSTNSKASGTRGGIRKLQGFFGEEFPGKDSSDTSLPIGVKGEHRSHSSQQGRSGRDRQHSNATVDNAREASPAPSRPRTPVPAPDVVPFLYQEAEDIARFGEAPVRDTLTGPDRQRYINENSGREPPKTASSGRSGHSLVHIGPHSHKHKTSNDDPRALRPSVSREDSTVSIPSFKDRQASTTMYNSSKSRAQSPAPSGSSSNTYFGTKNGSLDSPASSTQPQKKGLLNRLRRHKDKDDGSNPQKHPSISVQSLHSRPSKQELPPAGPDVLPWAEPPPPPLVEPREPPRPAGGRHQTFNNKFPFSKKNRSHRRHDDPDELIGPTDRNADGTFHALDLDLSNMEGILSRPLPLTPMHDAEFFNVDNNKTNINEKSLPLTRGPNGAWNAPDSWAVRPLGESETTPLADGDEAVPPPRPDEKLVNYCIRVFRSDGTFATLQLSLDATVQEVVSSIVRKSYVTEDPSNYHILLKKHDLLRVLGSSERPLLLQKRLLQQVGYEEKDRIEDLGREDNSYICRFLFLSAKESDFHAISNDFGLNRLQKFSHVDLSGRNLVTIPISLYQKASEIVSLNLSRNLSLDLPRDFIQSCINLRDVKFNNNEARRLPLSLSRASKLTYLDVSNNRLEQLEHAELNGLTGLLKLNLANNRLNHLPPYFDVYRMLRTLNISSNFLDKFPPFLCELGALVDLDLSFNLIGSFPEEIGRLTALEKFVVTNNRLTGSVPETFKQMRSLRELDVRYNALTQLDTISELPKLEMLAADHNAISTFVGSFERIRSLKLDSNPITKFEINQPVPTLKLLNLSNAQLASLDETLKNIPNLERLVLDKNYFVSLPAQIGNLRRLEHFSIANNTIGELPPEVGCLTELKVLNVRGNNIRKLPMELWWANKLETLNASSNVLDHFPKPSSRPPQAPDGSTSQSLSKSGTSGSLSSTPSIDEGEAVDSRRPSASSSTLLSVGPSPVPAGPDRKSSVVSVYGKGGRKTSVMSRSTTNPSHAGSMTPTTMTTASRKDSGLSQRLTNTFAGSLRNLYLADNQFDDDVFDQIMLLAELRVLNLSYNDLADMPQRTMKSWPQLVELYLSGNELTSIPADDIEEYSLLQVLHINGNKFTNIPADISRARRLAVFDCSSNYLKYNIANVPYDWNWNLNPNLRFLNLSGNRRLEIKQTTPTMGFSSRESFTDFGRLVNLRLLGLMDVTLTIPTIPDQSEDRRVRTSGSMAGYLPYGMADTLGKNEHLSTVDLVVPRFNSSDTELLLGLFDGQALSTGGSKIAKYLHENFGHIFTLELKALKERLEETPEDALRRAFLGLNKDLVTIAIQHTEERSLVSHRGSNAPVVLSKEDINSGGVATIAYLSGQELYVANVGDVQAIVIQSDGSHKVLTKKHDPAEPSERSRIREAGGWVSRNGRLNDLLPVSRAFGYVDLMPAVQAAPHISHVTIKDQDETVLIATRELWEYLTPGLVVDIARSERQDLMRASQKLRDLAMAYGAKDKIMVMMISVADLKRRMERSRLKRGTSMSMAPVFHDEAHIIPTRRGRRLKEGPLDSTLQRLEAEVPAPTGLLSIVFTDIKGSTNLWETYPLAMRSAIKLHNDVMRRQLRRIGGFEVKTEGDAFMVSFPTATSALLWCFAVQTSLLEVDWPSEMLNSITCAPVYDKDNNLIFKGLSVRMGVHWGEPLAELDPVTRRMDYYGPMVNKASRISACADGGQITVSSDFISEIQRCLETYQEPSSSSSSAGGAMLLDEQFDDDIARAIPNELRSLSSQGFEVKEMGEKKLKGLENPEIIYSLYPHTLVGRIDHHQAHEQAQANGASTPKAGPGGGTVASGSKAQRESGAPSELDVGRPITVTAINPEIIWALWKVSLRLEMLCSSLEQISGTGLQPPETLLLERMQQRGGGDLTDRFLVHFMEHQVSRIETCTTALALRHMANGDKAVGSLNDLRGPMGRKLGKIQRQLTELQRYREMFGPLSGWSEEGEGENDSEEDTEDTEKKVEKSGDDGDDESGVDE